MDEALERSAAIRGKWRQTQDKVTTKVNITYLSHLERYSFFFFVKFFYSVTFFSNILFTQYMIYLKLN